MGIKRERERPAHCRSENRFRSVRGDFVDCVAHVGRGEQLAFGVKGHAEEIGDASCRRSAGAWAVNFAIEPVWDPDWCQLARCTLR